MDVLGSHDGGQDETDPFGEIVVDRRYETNARADQTQESTSILETETMETEDSHQMGSPSTSESKAECGNYNVTTESHCLICYKTFTACEAEFDNFMNPSSSWELLKVFCKHMGVQVPSDDQAEMDGIFCDKCQECVRLILGRFDAELESLQKMISKLVLGCTAVVMESPRIACFCRSRQPNGQFLEKIRKDVFNRNCPQISVRDCCHGMDGVSSPSDREDAASLASYLEPDVETGADDGDNNGGDYVLGLTDDEEQQGPIEEVVVKEEMPADDDLQALSHCPSKSNMRTKGKYRKKIIEKEWIDPPFKPKQKESPVPRAPTRKLRERRTIQEPFEQRPIYAKVQGVETRLEEIQPGKYLFLQKFNFAKKVDDGKFQCSACDSQPLFDSLEDIVLHIRSEHAHQMEPWMLKPKSDHAFYYHNVRVDYVGRSYICSLCPKFKKKHRSIVMSHIYRKHYLPSLKPKKAGQTEDEQPVAAQESTNEDGHGTSTGEPEGSSRSQCTEDDDKVYEPESEDSVQDDDDDDEDYIPDDGIKEKEVKEKKKKKEENARFKLIEPGKYLYLNKFEVEKAEDGTYVCLLCKCRRSEKRYLLYHIQRTHLNRKESNRIKARVVDIGNDEFLYGGKKITKFQGQYSCEECGFLSEKLSAQREHIRYQHLRPLKGKPDRFMCEECGKTFVTKQALKIHREGVHEDGEKFQLCPICGKSLKRSALKQHVRRHKDDLPKNFVCEHCGKAFDGRHKLLSHVTTHTGEMPFECNYCRGKFKSYNVMCAHRKRCRMNGGQVAAYQAECSVAPVECSSAVPVECPVAPVECPVASVECPVAPAVYPVGPAVRIVTKFQQPQQVPVPLNTTPEAPPVPDGLFPA